MPDLLTHAAVLRLTTARVREPAFILLSTAGTFMPDLAAKTLEVILESPSHNAIPTHSLVGIVLYSYLASLFVEETWRLRAFAAILWGAGVHIGLDLLKLNAIGGYCVLHPFTIEPFQGGLFLSEDSIYFAPIAIILLLMLKPGRAQAHVH